MSYATEEDVGLLIGLTNCQDVDPAFLRMADTFVDSILGRSFSSTTDATEHFDLVDRSVYLENDVGSRDIPLTFWPVTTVSKVTLLSWTDSSTPVTPSETELTENFDYWVKTGDQGTVVSLSKDLYLKEGNKKVKIEYTWGYAAVPQDVVDFASYIAASMYDGSKSVARNSDGAPLEEIEIGRYREKYAVGKKNIYSSKYGDMIKMMEIALIDKYKLWN
jgi:hypothetical protein